MKITRDLKSIFILFGLLTGARCKTSSQKEEKHRMDTLDYSPGKRTFLISKLLILPSLATIGFKFLLLLPVFLAKIALFVIMNFVATNLNLIISGIMAVRNYFSGEGKPFWSDIHRHVGVDYWRPHHEAPPVMKLEEPIEIKNFVDNQFVATNEQEFVWDDSKKLNVGKITENNSIDKNSLQDDSWKYKCVWTKDNTNKNVYKRHHLKANKKNDKLKYIQWRPHRI